LESFSWGGAWSAGYQAVARRAVVHTIILAGLGIVVPLAVQMIAVGTSMGILGPAAIGPGSMTNGPSVVTPLLVVALVSYLLQTASYFGSWRLALAGSETPGRALRYGLLASLIVVPTVIVLFSLAAAAGFAAPEGLVVPIVMILSIPLLIAFAAFYSVAAATISVAVALMLLIAMIGGMALGQTGFAATMVGGSGAVVVMAIVMSGVLLWLAARLSCTAAIMANARSFNPIAAMRQSWDMTWDEQWSILRYLALIGLVLAIAAIGLSTAAAAISVGLMRNGQDSAFSWIQAAGSLITAVPIAFLIVMATTGIYRELSPPTVDAEVFA
jgi:hypothetical protein